MSDQEYISADAAAAELNVSRATIWKWLKRHKLNTYRFMGDRKTYIKRSDLAKLTGPVEVDFQKKPEAA